MKFLSHKRLWYQLHGWLTLPIWVLLLFICVTGTIATISQEIVWLYNPAVRANAPGPTAALLGYDAVLAAVQHQQPTALVSSISRPVKSQYALRVGVSYPDARRATLFVNPYTGHIQGSESGPDFRSVVLGLHGWLLQPWNNGYSWGWYLVCLLSLPMLGSLVSGLVIYPQFRQRYFSPRLRTGAGLRVLLGDLHRLVAAWSIPFIVIIGLTGLWFLVAAVLHDSHVSLGPNHTPVYVARGDVPYTATGQAAPRISPDQAVAAAQAAFPRFQPDYVALPGNAYAHYWVGGRSRSYPLLHEELGVNPYTARVEVTRMLADKTAYQIFSGSMNALHVGDFIGLGGKLVYFVFGLLLTALVASGMLIWIKRFNNSPAAQEGNSRWWLRWRYHASALVLLLPLVALPGYLKTVSIRTGQAGLGEREVAPLAVGPWKVRLAEWKAAPPQRDGEAGYMKPFILALTREDQARIKAVYLRVGKPRSLRTAGALASGSPYRLWANLPVPDTTTGDAMLWITVETWDGSVHQAALPLAEASPKTAAFMAEQNR